jgi:hypothetical protein
MNFVVKTATYDGSAPSWSQGSSNGPNDPLVCIQGTVANFNGYFPWAGIGVVNNYTFGFVIQLFWSQIQRANLAGGIASVQSLIAVAVQQVWLGLPVVLPTFQAIVFPAPVTDGSSSVVCAAAMVSPWQQ